MRHPLRRMSLRTRLLLITAGLLLAGLTLISAVVSDSLERYQLDRIDTQLRGFTELIARVPSGGLPAGDPRTSVLDPALDLIGAPYVVYLGANGAVTGGIHSSRLAAETLPPPEDLRSIPVHGPPVDLRAANGSERWRAVAAPAPGGTVIAAAPLAEADALISRLRISSVVTGSVLLVLLTG